MRKTLALIAVAMLAIILAAGPATGAAARDEFTIPLNASVNMSNNLTICLQQVTISNVTYGGAYSPDPENSVWPVLVIQYRNDGQSPVAARLHAQFVDNASTVYDKTDKTIYKPLYPGSNVSSTLEVAIPKSHILTQIIVIDDWTKSKTVIPIVYPSPTPEAPSDLVSAILVDDGLRNLLLIPLILVVVGIVGWLMARNRLF